MNIDEKKNKKQILVLEESDLPSRDPPPLSPIFPPWLELTGTA